jgi:hypothetical protein
MSGRLLVEVVRLFTAELKHSISRSHGLKSVGWLRFDTRACNVPCK